MPKWSSMLSLSSLLGGWPPPRIVGDAVYQLIPKYGYLSILSFLLSDAGTASFLLSDVEVPPSKQCFEGISASRDLFAYTVPSASHDALGKHRFVVGQIHTMTRRSVDLASISIPFTWAHVSHFDAYSSRIVFREGIRLYFGSL